MDQILIFLTLLGMQAVTYLPRVLPLWILSSLTLPRVVETWLHYVPPAVLAAMLFPAVLVHDQRLTLSLENVFFWAAIPTAAAAWKTRSFFGAVLTGMVVVALARAVQP
jgi:branched-subunit amino acid transport protein